LDALTVVEIDGIKKSRYEHFYGVPAPYIKFLRTFGEAGTVKLRTSTTPKMLNKGATCMFVGFPENHGNDCWSMYNPKTKGVHTTRDVVWLRRMYYQKPADSPEIVSLHDEGEDHFEDGEGEGQVNNDEEDNDAHSEEPNPETTTDNENPFADTINEISSEGSPESINDNNANEEAKDDGFQVVTRAGRVVRENPRFSGEEWTHAAIELTQAEKNYYEALAELSSMAIDHMMDVGHEDEFGLVGAALGGGFVNTAELHPMKYSEAMAGPDKEHWKKAVKEEYQRMVDHKVFRLVKRSDIPKDAKVLTSTWAMKKKSNGKYRARLNARGYEQVDGEHYDSNDVASPTVNINSVRIILVILLLMHGYAHLVDVNGAFLLGGFELDKVTEEQRKVYMEVPEGFEEFLPDSCHPAYKWLWELLATLYGTKQAAKRFWLLLLKLMKQMGYKLNRVDPCVYYKWTNDGLLIWASWVDDCLHVGPKKNAVLESKNKLTKLVKCDDNGEMKEYVGCKLEMDKEHRWMKITQPVVLQSFQDEFTLPKERYTTPAAPGTSLQVIPEGTNIPQEKQSIFCKAVGKLLHVMRWSRPDILNAVRETSRFMSGANEAQYKAVYRVMKYCADTPNRGLVLNPTGKWDGKDKSYKFIIRGKADSDYAKDIATRRSVGGRVVYLNDAPVIVSSKMQKGVGLSVTETEVVEQCEVAQDMLYCMRFLKEMELQVQLPMILECDNQGAVDLINNWSSSGRTRHMDVRYKFLHELKEGNIIRVVWCPTESNEADVFTKNLSRPLFEKHIKNFVGQDEYMVPDT
jgi:hypothetical protein